MTRLLSPRARPFLALLGLVLLLVAGCDNLVRPQYRFAQVRVRATDPAGGAVPGVGIVLYAPGSIMGRGVTGADGEYLFTEVAAGPYGVSINVPQGFGLGPGELPYVDTLTIVQGARREVTFVLYPAR